jgi:hypothetical protein
MYWGTRSLRLVVVWSQAVGFALYLAGIRI